MSVKSFKTSGVGVDLAPKGLVLINTTSFSAVSSVILPANSFTTSYTNYLLVLAYSNSTTGISVQMRGRTSGTTNTTSNYVEQFFGGDGASASAARGAVTTSWQTKFNTGGNSISRINLFNMAQNVATKSVVVNTSVDFTNSTGIKIQQYTNGWTGSAVSFDSVEIFPNGGTITGTYNLYAFNE